MDHAPAGGHLALLHQILELQRRLLDRVDRLGNPQPQSWYSPAEAARLIRRRPGTVRGWCRTGRMVARKRSLGRGGKLDWEISAEELRRYRDHGLLPKGE